MKEKVLCVCASGHVRSVALARLLDKRGREAAKCGLKHRTVLPVLCGWADRIYFMGWDVRDELLRRFAEWAAGDQAKYLELVRKLDGDYIVGHDDWKDPSHPLLLEELRRLVDTNEPPSRPLHPLELWESLHGGQAE